MGILALRCPNILPLSLRRATPTLETLAYDCGNPGQYVCGRYARTPLSFPRPGPPQIRMYLWGGQGGNRAWVVISYLIRENNSVLWFYLSKIRNTNLIDPIPAYAGMTKCLLCGGRGNDKGVRANARRHIVLDCHSRTPTFSTLIVLLRNDRELCADSIYTLNSTLYTLSIPRHGAELTQMSLALL